MIDSQSSGAPPIAEGWSGDPGAVVLDVGDIGAASSLLGRADRRNSRRRSGVKRMA